MLNTLDSFIFPDMPALSDLEAKGREVLIKLSYPWQLARKEGGQDGMFKLLEKHLKTKTT